MVKGNVGNALYALTNADEMRAQRALHETYNDIFETDNGKITVDTCWVAIMKKDPFKQLRDMWAEDGDLDG